MTTHVDYAPPQIREAASIEPPEPSALDRLDDIALLVRALTYGEMIEFAEAIWKVNAGVELTQEALPAALHRWSVSR